MNSRLLNRRSFIAAGASLAAVSLLRTRSLAGTGLQVTGSFPLGVASGDPSPDGFVLWTRVAKYPFEPDRGAPTDPVEVHWRIAEDESMRRILKEGVASAEAAWAHSVHVEVEGLRPDRWYWYQFRVGDEVSPLGRTRTLPAADSLPGRLRFAFASCQKYETGYYTAYEHMARENLDLVVFLGDYIYEKEDSSKAVRPHGLETVRTLDDYRRRYAVYKSDAALQQAHAVAPWIVTWDDHEVGNDYAGDVPENPDELSTEEFLQRRAAAYQAYYEHMPLRRAARPVGPDMRLYRRLDYGRLARFQVLDTRQYRSDQLPGPRRQTWNTSLEDPSQSMLGAEQRDWLAEGLVDSPAIWNVIAQQVLMARIDLEPGPEFVVDVDKWAGYENERRWLLDLLRDRGVSNPIVLTGDVHSNWANELTADAGPADVDPVAVELVGTSISAGGNGTDDPERVAALMDRNPFVKFHNDERGYVRCDVTPTEWRADFQTVPFINRRGAPLVTRGSFVIEAGKARLKALSADR